MAAIGRGRSLKNLRIRGRNDSGEENVPLDLTREPSDNLREILQNVAKLQGVSNMRKLGHLNNFTKLLCDIGHSEEKLGFNYEDIIICLRLALLNEAKEVRAAGLRALRYLIHDSSILQKVLKLKVDYLIARCIDIQQSNEVERTQALRLVRKMITVNASLFPSSVANSLIAVGNDGLQERDRMVRACIAIICELALQNPEVVALRGGLNTILKNVIDCQLSRINEALITTILHLLNHPKTRQYVRADVELELKMVQRRILAPYTDFHYRHSPDTAEGQLKEDREARFLASKLGIIATFRSWAGIINLCKPGNSGIQSLIGVLCIPNMEIRRGLLEVLYDIFRLPLPVVTDEFIEALLSVDPGRFQDSWRLSDGFVAAEAKTILPHRARSRPDLMDNYLALILSAFIRNGLLEGLVEVITNSDDHISVRATILLGELLHMANTILPHSHSHHLHCLPTLMNMAASFDIPKEKRLRASAALNCLKRFHEMKKRGPKPYSLHLDHIVQKAIATHQKRDQYLRVQKDIFVLKDTEEALLINLRDSQVLQHKENLEWNWNLIGTILKWPNVNLRNYKDEQLHRFVRRLLYFYKPSSKLYASLDLDFAKAKQLTVVGCQFTEFLLESEEDGQGYLEDLVKDIVQWLNASSGMKPERSLQNNGLLTTLSQHYFLFIGTLSCHPHGVKMLEKCSVFQCLLNLCSLKNQDHLLKLTVSSLDYSRDGLARVILSKVLTAATDACRLYATKHLRVLLRANVEFFNNWGIELLVTQLHDKNKTISSEALDILDEACEDKANLHALIQMKPALSHLGDKGLLLLLRFLSIPKGFSYLNERGYVAKQLEKWHKEYNSKYVDLIEEQLNEALTTYRKPVDGDNYVRRSNQSYYSDLTSICPYTFMDNWYTTKQAAIYWKYSIITELCRNVRTPDLEKWEEIKQLKGNIGSSNWGLNLLQEENVIPDILKLAKQCEVLSIRGTCVYVLGLIAKTKQGCDILKCHSWDSVRHSRRHLWPVVPDDVEQLCSELSSVPSTLSLNSESTGSRHNSESESAPASMFILEDDRFGSTSTSTFFLDINEEAEPAFYDRPGPIKDKNSFPFFASSKLVKNRILNSLTLPTKKHRSSSDPKGGKLSSENKTSNRRIRTLTEPSVDFNHSEDFTAISPAQKTLQLETSFVGNKHLEDTGSTPSIGENDLKFPKSSGTESHRESTSRERLAVEGSGSSHMKIRSQSFNTDTTTSGISSMSSSPSRETVGVDPATMDTDCGSLSTVVMSLVPPGSSHTLPRRAQSLKAPSIATIKSLADCNFSYTSSRDAFGYATLKRLQQQRMHPSLSHSEALASPAKDVLFTDTITMKANSFESRLTPSRIDFKKKQIHACIYLVLVDTSLAIQYSTFMKALSYASLDKEDLLSPINQNTLQRSSSVRSMVSSATYGGSDDYIGLALPVDINDIFQHVPPPDDRGARMFSHDGGGLSSGTGGLVKNSFHLLRQQMSLTEIMNSVHSDASLFLESTEDTGLQEHTDDNCLYCVCIEILGFQPSNQLSSICSHSAIWVHSEEKSLRTEERGRSSLSACKDVAKSGALIQMFRSSDLQDIPYSDWCEQTIPNPLGVVPSKFSGISGCSDGASQEEGSASSTKSTELLLGVKTIPDDTPMCRILLRKEVLRLVINLSSSVSTKCHETGLLTIKEKYPQTFDDICLYSEVSHLLSHCTFRLPCRRFIQELFQDVQFLQMHEEAEAVLAIPPNPPIVDESAES
ncbi:Rapamycin-insensitive companion of mTOR [Apodemus speciosus]|uniref:Rapamycin-insensitive companion of mTOR n=1 Tax=Apodemus speciosus TaxID=105296 RepID=A0ABQ0FJ41_APOSI